MHALLDFAKWTRRAGNPVQAPVPELRDAQLAACYYDHRVGGDCYEFMRVSPTRVFFALFDVAGRIEENRPVVTAVQNVFRTTTAQLFSRDDVNEADAMVELCLELNRTILETADHVCSTPAFAGCYNESLGTVSYFNAGHTPGLLADDGQVIELRATGLPLGLFSHATPDASIVALQPGDALVVVSRGIVEARHRRQEFGLDPVKKNLQQARMENATEICAGILDTLREFTSRPSAENDITVVALSRQAAAAAAGAGN
ncbi:MAG TPA: SpoIIE family protein phosphatase [Candidatus Angelobacter sp.]|nr:SpoIIE family protein phosphatase [Candidatus Angelobacter sp.]